MRLHNKKYISDYCNTDLSSGPLHTNLTSHIAPPIQQIDRFLHILPPQNPHSTYIQSPHDKTEPLNSHLRQKAQEFRNPGTYLAVDETIAKCMDRAREIVNIPAKPTPEGLRI